VSTIYEVPLKMQEQNMDEIVLRKLGMPIGEKPVMQPWRDFLDKKKHAKETVRIALVGKYVELPDAYKSINESLLQAATYNERKLDLQFVLSDKLTDENVEKTLASMDGIVIAPGFGPRGLEGKICALKYAREHDVPTFGVCLGMQCMVIEFARNVLGLDEANSTEMNPHTPFKVIDLMEEQKNITNMGGTMRLGAYKCELEKGSVVYKAYGKKLIQERHRHRFEFNGDFKEDFEKNGMKCTGVNPEMGLVEVVEIPELKWYLGVQFHPEYNSTVVSPNPLFISFVKAVIDNKKK
ncbi:MAG: CTP synthase, partial [Prevotella sp.]|nr:CTP synthase [Prevotella sp.]